MWATAEPVVRAWIEQNLGPVGKLQDAGRAAQTLGRFAAGLPAALLRAEGVLTQLEGMAEEGVDLSESAIVSLGEAAGARRAARPYRAVDHRRTGFCCCCVADPARIAARTGAWIRILTSKLQNSSLPSTLR